MSPQVSESRSASCSRFDLSTNVVFALSSFCYFLSTLFFFFLSLSRVGRSSVVVGRAEAALSATEVWRLACVFWGVVRRMPCLRGMPQVLDKHAWRKIMPFYTEARKRTWNARSDHNAFLSQMFTGCTGVLLRSTCEKNGGRKTRVLSIINIIFFFFFSRRAAAAPDARECAAHHPQHCVGHGV
jgi:hypothetical protein